MVGTRLASRYWLTGSGLGTFRYVNKPELPMHREVYYEYAENQYVETAVEAGIGGLALLLLAIAFQTHILWRLLKSSAEALPWAAAGVFALASQTVQAAADFGLYLPSNLLLFGVVCGAIAGRTAMLAEESRAPRRRALILPGGAYLCPVIVTVLLMAAIAGAIEARAAAAIDRERIATQWNGDPKLLVREDVESHAAQLGSALHWRWDDAAGQARMAELDIVLFRFRAVDELRSADTSDDELWPLTSPAALHARAAEMARDGDTAGLEQLRASPSVVAYLGPAWRHLAASREACPMFDEVHTRLGELAFLVGDPLDDHIELERALSLEPNNLLVLIRVGLLDLDSGRPEQGAAELRRAWELDGLYTLGTVGDTLISRAPMSLILNKIAPHTPEALILLGERLIAPSHRANAQQVLQVAEEVVNASSMSDAQRAYYLGKIALLRGSVDSAIDHYRRAVELDGSIASWHYEFALLWERAGHKSEALEEARRAWRLEPDRRLFTDLMNRLASAGSTE
jgi:tetratricopeptide (TPR) repeat protein